MNATAAAATAVSHQVILVLDFGSQYTQLIARRLRELHVYSEIIPFATPAAEIVRRQPAGLILSGGPMSVNEAGAPHCDYALFEMGVPVLGICYGMQLMTQVLGGTLTRSSHREFGHADVTVGETGRLFAGLERTLKVWASHGDSVAAAPPGFDVVASSTTAPVVAIEHRDRALYGLLFHPEVVHTQHGADLLRTFAIDVCGCRGDWTMASFIDEAVARIQAQVGDGRVVCGLSGGVDSTVAALLVHKAIGDRLTCIFVDNGLLREQEAAQVEDRFRNRMQLPLVVVDAASRFLARLAGVTDPEKKRKIIGAEFIDVFEDTAKTIGSFDYLAQGTLYPDVI
ncbi:MAG TPA: glutamine-hydrolyzing GMP synthase, partial [Vicinamibacterales bacterium]|nr:glutamine-hydrolyzing GMP synthase [Vicinamibacterales bacterium]